MGRERNALRGRPATRNGLIQYGPTQVTPLGGIRADGRDQYGSFLVGQSPSR